MRAVVALCLASASCVHAPAVAAPKDPARIVRSDCEPVGGISIGSAPCPVEAFAYAVDGVDVNDPAFGALTFTWLVDGRREHYGVGGP